MSWESSAQYYRLINEATRERLGGLHSADCLLRSVDFAEIEQLQRDGAWERRLVHDVIYRELCVGLIRDASRGVPADHARPR